MLTVSLLVVRPGSGEEHPPGDGDAWRLTPFSAVRGTFEVRLKAYAQIDGRAFPNWSEEPLDRVPEFELRRTRLGTEVRWRGLRLEVDVDPQDTEDRLKDAYAAFEVSKALRIQAGRTKLPTSPERLRPAARLDFVERSLLATYLATDRDLGLLLHGDIGKRLSYRAGVFAGDGESGVARAGTTVAARLAVDFPKGLAAGASFSEGTVRADGKRAGEEARPNGLRARAVAGPSVFDRHFVHGRRRRLGLDGSWSLGPGTLKAEVLEAVEERRGQGLLCEGLTCEDLSEEVGLGWAVTGTWRVGSGTKETKKRRLRAGVLTLAVRYESLRFDDRRPTSAFESVGDRARNIRPAGIRVFTGGASWWPIPWGRLIANVVVERFSDPVTAPLPGRAGPYVTLVGRMQMRLP
jgi:phosphate-selective porin